jgi:hypothetical protein
MAVTPGPEARLLGSVAERKVYNIVHLIYRAKNYEGHSKDYEFSRLSMQEHWRAGYHDARRRPRHPGVLKRPDNHESVFTFDLVRDGNRVELPTLSKEHLFGGLPRVGAGLRQHGSSCSMLIGADRAELLTKETAPGVATFWQLADQSEHQDYDGAGNPRLCVDW